MSAPTIANFSPVIGSAFDAPTTLPKPSLGDVIVVILFAFSAISTGITDNASNVYTAQAQQQDGNSNYVNLFTAPVTSLPTSTLIISSSNGGGLALLDITGVATGTFIDGTVQVGTYSGSAGGSVTAAAITTSVATDLIISAAFNQNGSVMTAGTGVLVTNGTVGSDFGIVQARTTTSAGNYSESITVPASPSETAGIVAIAIKGTSSGSSVTPTVGATTVTGNAPTVTPALSTVITPFVARKSGVLMPRERKIFLPSRRAA